ncbi:MAG: redoxin domain-containing protein [Candidatus Diapherotrites archaeon]|nr:redoxin domain-containing protein [Candidatus Diapherotrites archaeon]
MRMEFKPNNPVQVGLLLLLIIGGILFLESTKAKPLGNENTQKTLAESESAKRLLYPSAPELQNIAGYVNVPHGFSLSDVKGKVILVDFWTYSCINCIRTLPYLKAWHEQYADKGLVIVGVHTPEFAFEEEYENVKAAVEKQGIEYAVVLDNEYATWRAYKNQYWPRKYLVDADGFIRYDHIGEGGYEETEKMIQKLLTERDEKLSLEGIASEEINAATEFSKIGTPEIYLGYDFARAPLGNAEGFQPNEIVVYALPSSVEKNRVYLEGTWENHSDHVRLASDTGKIVLKYEAKSVNIVAGGTAQVEVEPGQSPGINALGTDAQNVNGKAVVQVAGQKLYNVVSDSDYFEKTLTLHVNGKGFELYTFTFG